MRALRADEVECRVGQITANGCSLLLYKDSRCDKRILDETYGVFGWQDSYQEIKGNLFCTVSVWDKEKQQWISKQDCGTESNMEKEKGEASDAFKRACFNLGIGRELYTKIFIWLKAPTESNGRNGYKLKNPYQKWHVGEMDVDAETEKIVRLVIQDENNNTVFTYEKGESFTKEPKAAAAKQPQITRKASEEQIATLRRLVAETKGNMDKLLQYVGEKEKCSISSPEELTELQILNLIKSLQKRGQNE